MQISDAKHTRELMVTTWSDAAAAKDARARGCEVVFCGLMNFNTGAARRPVCTPSAVQPFCRPGCFTQQPSPHALHTHVYTVYACREAAHTKPPHLVSDLLNTFCPPPHAVFIMHIIPYGIRAVATIGRGSFRGEKRARINLNRVHRYATGRESGGRAVQTYRRAKGSRRAVHGCRCSPCIYARSARE
jgi:hypothetical protein